MKLRELQTPELILDRAIMARNINRMARRAAELGAPLRPHLKTPKSVHVAQHLSEAGAAGFNVSTLREAEHFFANGVDDLYYCVPFAPQKAGRAAALTRSLRAAATALTAARRRAAADLARSVQQELHQLGMPQARFQVAVTPRPEGLGATGADAVEFVLEANPGEGPAPLRSVAAGGELSRVMLAVNAVPARAGGAATTVFDEIDAGVGGQIGVAIGERLRRIAERQQVLCITHLATVAARADTHLKVEKRTSGERSRVVAVGVDGAERVDELARMLAGDHSEGVTQQHASRLLEAARRPSG